MRGINSVFRLSVIVAAGLPLAAVASESARRPAAAPVTVDESNFAYPMKRSSIITSSGMRPWIIRFRPTRRRWSLGIRNWLAGCAG